MGLGIRAFFSVEADVAMASDTTLGTVGLLTAIAANQRMKIRAWVKASVGAAGGIKSRIVTPAGIVSFQATFRLQNTVAPSEAVAVQQAAADFTNALANAGTHWIEIEADIINGDTSGDVDIQFAQNTSDATPLTVLRGSSMDVTVY